MKPYTLTIYYKMNIAEKKSSKVVIECDDPVAAMEKWAAEHPAYWSMIPVVHENECPEED